MYPAELEIIDTTDSKTSASCLDVLSVDQERLPAAHFPLRQNVTISTSMSQTFRFWVPISHLHHLHHLPHSTYCMPGLGPLMFHSESGAIFILASCTWVYQGTFEIFSQEVVWSIYGSRQTLWSIPLPNLMTFLDMTIYSDALHRADISLNRDLTEMDLITYFDFITEFKEASIEHLQRVRLVNRGRLLLRAPGPVVVWNLHLTLGWNHFLLNLCFRTLNFEHSSYPYCHFVYWSLKHEM